MATAPERPFHIEVNLETIGPLEPGATVIATVNRKITNEQATKVRDEIKALFPEHDVVVTVPEITLSVKES